MCEKFGLGTRLAAHEFLSMHVSAIDIPEHDRHVRTTGCTYIARIDP